MELFRRNSKQMGYFSSDAGVSEIAAYAVITTLMAIYTVIAVLQPLIQPPCEHEPGPELLRARDDVEYNNPDYPIDACKFVRYNVLLGLNKWECDMCARIFFSIFLGSMIGWERRRADRAAGIRTMAMVCMGSCVFTIGSVYAFWDGPMSWDSARVSAAVPSGVGFLGAASIWKGTTKKEDGALTPEVHGLTTATSVWLSAAVGIMMGGAMYFPAVFSTVASIMYLRFAPRASQSKKDDAKPSPLAGDPLRKQLLPRSGASAHGKSSAAPARLGERRPSIHV